MKSTICLAEDRKSCEPSLKLLLLSLARHCPSWRIDLFSPSASEEFQNWLRRFPAIELHSEAMKGGWGWDVKPHAIMLLLDQGFDEVIWIDSDILVRKNILDEISSLDVSTIVATDHTLAEERDDSNGRRARLWGFPVGRSFPTALNSGLVRATRQHYHLMQDWWDLLQSDIYRDYQKRKWSERPVHMLGDQDVLTALLTSKKYAHIPLRVLARGKHILQFDGIWGYTTAERIRNLCGDGPAFIHSAAGKPWQEQWPKEVHGFRELIKWLYLDLSPYTLSASPYREQLQCDTAWMRPHYGMSRFLRFLGAGLPALTGLPMALVADLVRAGKWVRGLGKPNSGVIAMNAPQSPAKD